MKCGLHCIRIWCADTIKYFFFNVSLTLHLSITLTNDQLDAQLFNMFIRILYMFRAISCSSSGGQIVLIQHLVSSLSVGDRPVHRLSKNFVLTHLRTYEAYIDTCRDNLSLPSLRVNQSKKVGSVGCPGTSVTDYRTTLRSIPSRAQISKPKCLEKKTCVIATLSIASPTWTGLGSNRHFRSEKPVSEFCCIMIKALLL